METSRDDVKYHLTTIFVLLGASGCYSLKRKTKANTFLWIYKAIVLSSILFIIARIAPELTVRFTHVLPSMFLCFQGCGNLIVCWRSFSLRFGSFFTTLKKWEGLVLQLVNFGIKVDKERFSRIHTTCVVVAIVLVIIASTLQVVFVYVVSPSPDTLKQEGFDEYATPLPDTYVSRLSLVLPVIVLLLTIIVPAFFLVVISNMIANTFNAFNKYVRDGIETNKKCIIQNIGKLRYLHLDLCARVSEFDRDFRFLHANMFSFTLVMGILYLYLMVKSATTFLTVALFSFYAIQPMILLIILSTSAATVHEAAHDPLEVLYYLDVEQMSSHQNNQLNLFISKLTGPQIGFTVGGVFTITKDFILTVIGVFLTYFAVLYTL